MTVRINVIYHVLKNLHTTPLLFHIVEISAKFYPHCTNFGFTCGVSDSGLRIFLLDPGNRITINFVDFLYVYVLYLVVDMLFYW